MSDSDFLSLERDLKEGKIDTLQYRERLKARCGSAGLDLSLSHRYEIIYAWSAPLYGSALVDLRAACANDVRQSIASVIHPFYQGITRPLTFAEILRVRLDDKTSVLWNTYLSSCTGVLYKGNPKSKVVEFKIVPISLDFLAVPNDFTGVSLPVAFDSIDAEILRTDKVRCDNALTPKQAKKNRAWLAAAEYNQTLLNDYVDRAECEARARRNDPTDYDLDDYFMNFCTSNSHEDELRSLVLGDAGDSDAHSRYPLDDYGRFVRVCPQ